MGTTENWEDHMKVFDWNDVARTVDNNLEEAMSDDDLKHSIYLGNAAIAQGVVGVVQALQAINDNLIEIASKLEKR
jgi:hypothetical protein